jgi:hypothetical protein
VWSSGGYIETVVSSRKDRSHRSPRVHPTVLLWLFAVALAGRIVVGLIVG